MFNVKRKSINFQQVQWGGPEGETHLCHFKDALRIEAAPSHLTCAGDHALVCDRHDEAGHRARLLLQSGINDVAVAHLRRNKMARKCACCLCDGREKHNRAYFAQRHYTRDILYIKPHAIVRVVRQLYFFSSIIRWYENFGDSVNKNSCQRELQSADPFKPNQHLLCVEKSGLDSDWHGVVEISITLQELWKYVHVRLDDWIWNIHIQ